MKAQLSELKQRLKKVDERLVNPMASEESIRELLKTKNELIAEIQELEIKISKESGTYPKSLTRSLNESFEL